MENLTKPQIMISKTSGNIYMIYSYGVGRVLGFAHKLTYGQLVTDLYMPNLKPYTGEVIK